MNYEEMSDPEISSLVAKRWFDDVVQHGVNKDGSIYLDRQSEEVLVEFDPCNNPSDAWPIITKYGICTMVADCRVVPYSWFASTHMRGASGRITVMHENQLRAAMICFLKMKDAQHD